MIKISRSPHSYGYFRIQGPWSIRQSRTRRSASSWWITESLLSVSNELRAGNSRDSSLLGSHCSFGSSWCTAGVFDGLWGRRQDGISWVCVCVSTMGLEHTLSCQQPSSRPGYIFLQQSVSRLEHGVTALLRPGLNGLAIVQSSNRIRFDRGSQTSLLPTRSQSRMKSWKRHLPQRVAGPYEMPNSQEKGLAADVCCSLRPHASYNLGGFWIRFTSRMIARM